MTRLVVDGTLSKTEAAHQFGVSLKTVSRWVNRFRQHCSSAMQDRSSRPHRLRHPTLRSIVSHIIALRRQRWTGRHSALEVGVSPATVSRVLKHARLSRMKDLDPCVPTRGYEHPNPGDMIHLDIKQLGRFNRIGLRITGDRHNQSNQRVNGTAPGWEYVHVCVDDHSRLAFTQIYKDQKAISTITHLRAALDWYRTMGITVRCFLTDNACYKSEAFRAACKKLGIKHILTKPYTPRTNGKAERFIQTALREWAYAKPYASSDHRAQNLTKWLHRYNWHRPHGGIKHQTPIQRSRMKTTTC